MPTTALHRAGRRPAGPAGPAGPASPATRRSAGPWATASWSTRLRRSGRAGAHGPDDAHDRARAEIDGDRHVVEDAGRLDEGPRLSHRALRRRRAGEHGRLPTARRGPRRRGRRPDRPPGGPTGRDGASAPPGRQSPSSKASARSRSARSAWWAASSRATARDRRRPDGDRHDGGRGASLGTRARCPGCRRHRRRSGAGRSAAGSRRATATPATSVMATAASRRRPGDRPPRPRSAVAPESGVAVPVPAAAGGARRSSRHPPPGARCSTADRRDRPARPPPPSSRRRPPRSRRAPTRQRGRARRRLPSPTRRSGWHAVPRGLSAPPGRRHRPRSRPGTGQRRIVDAYVDVAAPPDDLGAGGQGQLPAGVGAGHGAQHEAGARWAGRRRHRRGCSRARPSIPA